MIRQKTTAIVVMALIFGLLCSLVPLSAMIMGNESDEAFESTGENGESITAPQARLSNSSGMERLIVAGAGDFLESQSKYLTFLKKYEMSEIQGASINELNQLLQDALTAMENAENTYSLLKYTADRTPYRYDTYWNLVLFDYNSFLYQRQLNRDIFSCVARYLSNGDVRGCYKEILDNCRDILARLKHIRETLEIGDKRSLNNIWRLSQKYSDSLLFGQYIAEVFFEI